MSERYVGARPCNALKTKTRILNSILSFTGSQCREVKMGEINGFRWSSTETQHDFQKVSASIATRGEFINERVKVLSQRCCYVSSRFFKLVYGSPWPFPVGIRHIPAYHVDYTTGLKLKTSWWIWFLQIQLFPSQDNNWCQLLVDYVFISCLDFHSDATHSLQMIHWWASDVMLNFSRAVLIIN